GETLRLKLRIAQGQSSIVGRLIGNVLSHFRGQNVFDEMDGVGYVALPIPDVVATPRGDQLEDARRIRPVAVGEWQSTHWVELIEAVSAFEAGDVKLGIEVYTPVRVDIIDDRLPRRVLASDFERRGRCLRAACDG